MRISWSDSVYGLPKTTWSLRSADWWLAAVNVFSRSGRAGDGAACVEKPPAAAAVAAAAVAAAAVVAAGFQSSAALDQASAAVDTSQAACPGAAAPGSRTPGHESHCEPGCAAAANRAVAATPAFFAFFFGERRNGGAAGGNASPRIARRSGHGPADGADGKRGCGRFGHSVCFVQQAR